MMKKLFLAVLLLNFGICRTGSRNTIDENARKKTNNATLYGEIKKSLENGVTLKLNRPLGPTTPLVHAAACGDVEAIELYLENGADVNYLDRFGISPLSMALFNKNAAAALYLLRRGANPYLADMDGHTSFFQLDSKDMQPDFQWPQELLDELQEYPFSFNSFKQWSKSLTTHSLSDQELRIAFYEWKKTAE